MATRTKAMVRYRNRYVRARGRSHRKGLSIPIAAVAGFAPLVAWEWGSWQTHHSLGDLAKDLCMVITGYNSWDNKWQPEKMMHGTFPILLGLLVHRLASKLGVNRALSRAGIPYVRV